MPVAYGEQVAAELLEAVPEFRPQLDEHVRDNGELLLHLLMADLARFAVSVKSAGHEEVLDRVLAVAERFLVEGDELTRELVAVSFVEHLGAETERGESEVVERFPTALAAELKRQRGWRP